MKIYYGVKFITAGKRSLGQDNVFTRVCHSVHRGESASGGCTSGGSVYRQGWADVSPEAEKRAVRIQLECFLVCVLHLLHESPITTLPWLHSE